MQWLADSGREILCPFCKSVVEKWADSRFANPRKSCEIEPKC